MNRSDAGENIGFLHPVNVPMIILRSLIVITDDPLTIAALEQPVLVAMTAPNHGPSPAPGSAMP